MTDGSTYASDLPAGRTGDRPASATALVADDDDVREVFRLWLGSEDRWDVREAADGREALDRLDGSVDVLVLDREMPAYTGTEVVERLDDTAFDGAVLVLSGRPPDADLDETDVACYATKPIGREEFVERLERTYRCR